MDNIQESTYIYKGITVELYDLWFDHEVFKDYNFYKNYITNNGGKALEIGSGSGRLLLNYIQEGLDVHGLDSSSEMIDLCNKKAAELDISPTLHLQDMRKINIPYSFRTIYIPMYTFQLIVQRSEIFETLRRLYLHLEKGGQLLITLGAPSHLPSLTKQGTWKVLRSTVRPSDQARIVLSEAIYQNCVEQVLTKWLKYEIACNDKVVDTYIKTILLRWYHYYEFILTLEKIGFTNISVYGDYAYNRPTEKHDKWLFSAHKN